MNPFLVITLEHGSLCVVAVHRLGLECVCVCLCQPHPVYVCALESNLQVWLLQGNSQFQPSLA